MLKLAHYYMYHLNTFHLLKTDCVNQREGKSKKFIKSLTLISLKNNL